MCSQSLGFEVFELGHLQQVVAVALFWGAAQTVAVTAQSVQDIEIVAMFEVEAVVPVGVGVTAEVGVTAGAAATAGAAEVKVVGTVEVVEAC